MEQGNINLLASIIAFHRGSASHSWDAEPFYLANIMAFISHSKSSFYMSEMEGDDLILVLGSPITHIKRQEILNLPRGMLDD